MKPLILVLTATLGSRESLQKTIETVRDIGGNYVKHVIVAPKVQITSIQAKYGNIECLAEPEGKKGIYAALNHGFRTYGHDYKYLTFINDDDYWLPDYKRIIESLINNPSLDMAYGKTQYINNKGEKIGTQTSSNQFPQFIPLLKSNIILLTQQATLIKSDLYFKIGGFDESYKLVADTKFWAELSKMNIRYKYINKECAAYMIQAGQLSSDHDTQRIEHERLWKEINATSYKSHLLAKLRFRLNNLPIYIKRYYKKTLSKLQFAIFIVKIIIAFLPWKLKRFLLNKIFHYEIHKTAHIGISFIYPKHLIMEEGAKIGHLNVAIHLDKIVLGKNSRIGRSNWITGFPTGTESLFFKHDKKRKSELIIGKETAITKRHHIDCTNYIHVGDYVTIAGYDSQFLTHSIDIFKSRQDSHPIIIGDYCFVSTKIIVLGGSMLPSYSVLAAGAVLNKMYNKEWVLYAGVPAKPKREISKEAKYFSRDSGFVY